MRTLRRANAISAPRKSATREFCKWRTEEHPRETKKNFERDDDEQRERENAERNKKEKEGETLGVLSLFFFLPVVSFFANTRDDREQSRTFYVSTQLLLFWSCCCRRRRRLSRGTREKSYDEEIPFLVRVFSIFSQLSSSLIAILMRGIVA